MSICTCTITCDRDCDDQHFKQVIVLLYIISFFLTRFHRTNDIKMKLLVNMIYTPMRFVLPDKCIYIVASAAFPVSLFVVPASLKELENHFSCISRECFWNNLS